MNGKQSEKLTDVVTIESNNDEMDDTDKGPCEEQVIKPHNVITQPEDETYGCISSKKTQVMFEGDSTLAHAIRSKVTPRLN
jgi:hypothetical protein